MNSKFSLFRVFECSPRSSLIGFSGVWVSSSPSTFLRAHFFSKDPGFPPLKNLGRNRVGWNLTAARVGVTHCETRSLGLYLNYSTVSFVYENGRGWILGFLW